MRSLRFVLIFAVLLGCKTRSSESAQKHIFNDTGRPEESIPLTCDREANESLATAYLNHLAAHIIESGGPQFKASFEGKTVCAIATAQPPGFVLGSEEEKKRSAFADASLGIITVSPFWFKYLNSEDVIAALLAHELAHLSMAHYMRIHPNASVKLEPLIARYRQEVINFLKKTDRSNEELAGELLLALNRLVAALKKHDFESLAEENKNIDYISSIDTWDEDEGLGIANAIYARQDESLISDFSEFLEKRAILSYKFMQRFPSKIVRLEKEILALQELELGRSVVANWSEQEADEVGLEAYIRAGFDPQLFTKHLRYILQWRTDQEDQSLSESQNFADCEKTLSSIPSPEPVRGNDTHPELCWRIWNLEKKEWAAHQGEYEKFPVRRYAGEIKWEEVIEYLETSGEIDELPTTALTTDAATQADTSDETPVESKESP